jgi:repressor LexA
MSTTGERIKALRKAQKMSQLELARRTGYSDRSIISKIESGGVELNESGVLEFAKVLGVTPAELLGLTEIRIAETTISFPVLGEVAAGFDKDAVVDDSLGSVEIPRAWLHGRPAKDFFVLRVSGDSMYPIYQDGDLVLVLHQSTMNYSGQIGVVSYDDDLGTLKKIEYAMGEDWMRLVPLNPQYAPITIRNEALEHCHVHGIAKMVIRTVN